MTTFVETVEREVGKRVLYGMPSFTAMYPVPQQFVRDRCERRLFRRPERPNWSDWQVSSVARVQGTSEPVDLNVWRGGGTVP